MLEKKRYYRPTPYGVHVRNAVWEEIAIVRGQVMYRKWIFMASDYRCGLCKSSDDVVFFICKNGVFRVCQSCWFTEAVSPIIDGVPRARLIAEKQVTATEAYKILDRTGQSVKRLIPKGLPLRPHSAKRKRLPTPEELGDL